MIDFYKHKEKCLQCYEAEEVLKNLVVSHTVYLVNENPALIEPTIFEGKKEFTGHAKIKTYMDELEKTMELWNQFQGDSCYIGKDNKPC